jgi:cobalamin biosynthesis protein CobT
MNSSTPFTRKKLNAYTVEKLKTICKEKFPQSLKNKTKIAVIEAILLDQARKSSNIIVSTKQNKNKKKSPVVVFLDSPTKLLTANKKLKLDFTLDTKLSEEPEQSKVAEEQQIMDIKENPILKIKAQEEKEIEEKAQAQEEKEIEEKAQAQEEKEIEEKAQAQEEKEIEEEVQEENEVDQEAQEENEVDQEAQEENEVDQEVQKENESDFIRLPLLRMDFVTTVFKSYYQPNCYDEEFIKNGLLEALSLNLVY